MNTTKEGHLRRNIERFRQIFCQVGGGIFDRVLTAGAFEKIVTATCKDFRERIYFPLETLRLFIGQVLSEDHACQGVVSRCLSERVAAGQTPSSLNTGPYCKARDRMPLDLPVRLLQEIGQSLEAQSPQAWRWRGRVVKIFDGTTVSMPDTPENQAVFPQSPEQKPGLGFPIARLGGLIGLASGAVIGYALCACEGKGTGEQTLLRKMLPLIDSGDILLADALLTTWWIVVGAHARGADVVMPQNGQRLTDFLAGILLGRKDHVVVWPRPVRPAWMSVSEYQTWPKSLIMREVEVGGRVLVTTLLDRDAVTPEEIDALYAMRWNIEVDFRTIKVSMEMDVLRCKQPDRVEKEVAVHLLAYNLVRWAMASAASLGHVLPRALGFMGAKRVLNAFADHLRHATGKQITAIIASVLGSIASLVLPYRPGRIDPRAKKRRPKNLPLLTVPRNEARELIKTQREAMTTA